MTARAGKTFVKRFTEERELTIVLAVDLSASGDFGSQAKSTRELSVEAVPEGQGRGWGRSLITDALALVPEGEVIFAAVAPGNARSIRAFLGVGFTIVGSETIIVRPLNNADSDRTTA